MEINFDGNSLIIRYVDGVKKYDFSFNGQTVYIHPFDLEELTKMLIELTEISKENYYGRIFEGLNTNKVWEILRSNQKVFDIINEYINEEVGDRIDETTPEEFFGSAENLFEHIRTYYTPEEVFSTDILEFWAKTHGYVQESYEN